MNQMIRQYHRLLRLTRPTRTIHTSPPPLAAPSTYVTGVTPEQIACNPAIAEYYRANFGSSWESDPDTISIPQPTVDAIDYDTTQVDVIDEHAPILPPEIKGRNIRPLIAYARRPGKESGSRNCHTMRNPFQTNHPDIDYFPLIPGILHGSDPTQKITSVDPSSKLLIKTPWFEIQRELDRHHHSFTCRIYVLTVYSSDDCHVSYHKSKQNIPPAKWKVCQETMTITEIPPLPPPLLKKRTPIIENALVIPTDLQMHPIDHTAFCLNFIRYHPGKPIRLPIQTINEEESPAMKRGGFIAFTNKTIECLIDENAVVPEYIPLECSGLRQKDVVRRDRLVLPEGVVISPRVSEDYLLGSVFGAKGGGAIVEEEEEKKKK